MPTMSISMIEKITASDRFWAAGITLAGANASPPVGVGFSTFVELPLYLYVV
jgi:hypothetical protein